MPPPMDQDPTPGPKPDRRGHWMVVGTAVGAFLGLLIGKFAIGLIFGFFVGIIIGSTKSKAALAQRVRPSDESRG